MAAKTIKTAVSGAVELDGKFRNDEEVVIVIKTTVKAEPHRVSTATKGGETKMSLKAIDAIVLEGAEANKYKEMFADMDEDEDDGKVKLEMV